MTTTEAVNQQGTVCMTFVRSCLMPTRASHLQRMGLAVQARP
jgi:hypothetical protein